jgi:DNA segregation ATPase FtsK/SpoIIIE, S-DNA-T family
LAKSGKRKKKGGSASKKGRSGSKGRDSGRKTGGTQKKGTETAPAEPKLTPGRIRALWGVGFLALAIFTFLCIFAPSTAGIVGRGVKSGLAWAFGLGRFAVPFIFLAGAAVAFTRTPEVKVSLIAVGTALICVSILALLHISTPTGAMFTYDELSGGGGLVGAIVAWPLVKLFGELGAYIFTFALLAAGIVVAFEEQLAALWKSLKQEKPKEERPAPEVVTGSRHGGGRGTARHRRQQA